MAWESESEERMAAPLRRAVWSADESEREPAGSGVVALTTARMGWDDEEGPVRGRLRRALLADD
jgi:hypothetical protein